MRRGWKLHFVTQPLAGASQSRHHRADRDFKFFGDFTVVKSFKADEQQDLSMLKTETAQSPVKIQGGGRISTRGNDRIIVFGVCEFHRHALPLGAPQPVDMQIVQNRAQPAANSFQMFKLCPLAQCTFDAVLHKIIRSRGIADQDGGIPPQGRKLRS